MIIKKVDNTEEASICDNLLTKLINDEKKYNDNLKEDYIVKDYFKNIYHKENRVLLIAKEEKIIGYTYVKIITDDNGPTLYREALIDGLYVEEEYRNKGIGTKLIEEAIEWCKNNDVKCISLHAINKNIAAKRLYDKLGFEVFYLDMKREV